MNNRAYQSTALISIIILFFSCNSKNPEDLMSNLNLIPMPTSINHLPGKFDIQSLSSIVLINNLESEKSCAELFQEYLEPIKYLKLSSIKELEENQLYIELDTTYEINPEGYSLLIDKGNGIHLKAPTTSGLFYGFQTFKQLCDPSLEKKESNVNTKISNCEINDAPKFPYRGMHLDVSRHFFDITFIKTYIDMIAFHKMNVFHWHLTDDNGWRIEIKKYPGLTDKSAWRVDRRHEPWKEWSPIKPNEKATYGGFYTQDEIREVVQYAAKKNILVIPEIEMPGHTSEVFAAYPELSCTGKLIPVNPGSYWPNEDIFCAGNDNVFTFLENVLTEVISLFPGSYVHIGGDEAEKTNWETCKSCQERIKKEGLKDEHELQSWFIKRIEKFILKNNKKLIGWDEILEGGLAPSATVMSWRGMNGGIESARAGHDVVMCPTSHCYFDYYQADPENSPNAFGGYTTLKKVYSFNPIPEELSKDESKFILGGQGNLWTEYVQTPSRAQYRVLPRMTALSEVLWTGTGLHSFENFYYRLIEIQKRFDNLGWTYAPGSYTVNIQADRKPTDKSFSVDLTSEKPDKTIHFTINGENPSIESSVFSSPIIINRTTTIKAALFIDGNQVGSISEKTIFAHKAMGKKVKYNGMFKERYSGRGDLTLVDGITGTTSYSDGFWQGWESTDIDVIIDLEKIEKLNKVSIGFLESHQSWIFLPSQVSFSFSKDGISFGSNQKINVIEGEQYGNPNRYSAEATNLNIEARYVKVIAKCQTVCPQWHAGAGGKTWLFADEIVVE